MLHLTVYHQSYVVADDRKASAGKLLFKNESSIEPKASYHPQLSPIHISLTCFLPNTAGFVFCFGFIFSLYFFSILPIILVPFYLFLNHLATMTLSEAIIQWLLPHTRHKWFPQGVFSSVRFGNKESHTKTEFARLQRADNDVGRH